jgi:protoporphyrinogen oxidase
VVFRHPRRGTAQIVDALVSEIVARGGRFLHGAEVTSIEHRGGRVRGVDVVARGRRRRVAVDTLVSGMPMLALARALGFVDESLKRADWNRRRFTYLGYFFLDAPPRFPHAWLEVSCPRLAIGRVTSFGAFGGSMVPPGKGALSAELYIHDLDRRCAAPDDEVLDEIQRELVDAGLIVGDEVAGRSLIRIAGAEASNDYRSWADPAIVALDEAIFGFENLYDVNRAGIDVATLAGLEAARAIATGDRAKFRAVADPKVAYTDYERLA